MDVPGPCVNNVQEGAVTTRLFSFWCVRSITSPGLTQVLFLLCDTGVTHTGEWHDLCSYGWPRNGMCSGSTWSVNQPVLCVCQVSLCSGLQPCSRFRNSWVPVSLAGLSALSFGVWNSQRPCTLLEVQILREVRERIVSIVLSQGWLKPCTGFARKSKPGYPLLTSCWKGNRHINAMSSWFPNPDLLEVSAFSLEGMLLFWKFFSNCICLFDTALTRAGTVSAIYTALPVGLTFVSPSPHKHKPLPFPIQKCPSWALLYTNMRLTV